MEFMNREASIAQLLHNHALALESALIPAASRSSPALAVAGSANMSAIDSSSYVLENAPSPDEDDVDSLPSTDTHSSLDDDDIYNSDAEREWRESLQQIELLLTMVIVPYLGKYFGRKAAYWGMFDNRSTG